MPVDPERGETRLAAETRLYWDDGRLLTLEDVQSRRCAVLADAELYLLLLYNASPIDQNADVTVVWSNDVAPSTATLPRTMMDAGRSALLFLSGSDSRFATVSLGITSLARIECVGSRVDAEGYDGVDRPNPRAGWFA